MEAGEPQTESLEKPNDSAGLCIQLNIVEPRTRGEARD